MFVLLTQIVAPKMDIFTVTLTTMIIQELPLQTQKPSATSGAVKRMNITVEMFAFL